MGGNSSKTFTDRDTVAKDKKDLDSIYDALVKDLNAFVKETGYSKGLDISTLELVEVTKRGDVCANFGLFEDRFSKWSEEELRVFGQKIGLKVQNQDQILDKEGICGTLFTYVSDRADFNLRVIESIYDRDKAFCLYSSLDIPRKVGTDSTDLEGESNTFESNQYSTDLLAEPKTSESREEIRYDTVYRLYRDLKKQTKTNQEVQSRSGKTGSVGPLSTTSITNLDSAFSQLASKRSSFIKFLRSIADKLGSNYYITSRDLQKLKAEFESKSKEFSQFCLAFFNYLDNGGAKDGLRFRDPNDISTNLPDYPVFRVKA